MQGKLLIFSAPSGSGKTSIVKALLEKIPGLEFSVSATSRPPRGEEKEGREYYFLQPEEFRSKIAEEAFVEWEEVYPGRYYGTLKTELERIWAKGNHVLFDVDVVGGLNLKQLFGKRALAVFIRVENLSILEDRLRKRNTDDEASIKIRLDKALAELRYEKEFDLIIINDRLERAVEEAATAVSRFLEKP